MTKELQPHEVHPEDLALYALGSLEAAELARIRKHLEGCASCRLELQELNTDIGVFGLAATPAAEPSGRVRERLMAEIGRRENNRKPGWTLSWAFRAVVALILLAAVIVEWRYTKSLRAENRGLKQQLAQEETASAQARAIAELMKEPDAMRLTLMPVNSSPHPMAHVICSQEKKRLFLMANDLAPLGPGKMYELWLLPKSGKPVPAGMFNTDAHWNAEMLHGGLPSDVEAKGFAITVEPAEGSPAPTSAPILMGTES